MLVFVINHTSVINQWTVFKNTVFYYRAGN